MSITRSDEGEDKEKSGMGVGLSPREGSDGGRMRDWMEGGSNWGDQTGRVRQETG